MLMKILSSTVALALGLLLQACGNNDNAPTACEPPPDEDRTEQEGLNCCVVRKYCDECDFCDADDQRIWVAQNEEVCRRSTDRWLANATPCHRGEFNGDTTLQVIDDGYVTCAEDGQSPP